MRLCWLMDLHCMHHLPDCVQYVMDETNHCGSGVQPSNTSHTLFSYLTDKSKKFYSNIYNICCIQ